MNRRCCRLRAWHRRCYQSSRHLPDYCQRPLVGRSRRAAPARGPLANRNRSSFELPSVLLKRTPVVGEALAACQVRTGICFALYIRSRQIKHRRAAAHGGGYRSRRLRGSSVSGAVELRGSQLSDATPHSVSAFLYAQQALRLFWIFESTRSS